MPADPAISPAAALETLASYFDRNCYSTALVTGHDRLPRLTIVSRGAGLAYDIYADRGWYWSAEPAQLAHSPIPGPQPTTSAT